MSRTTAAARIATRRRALAGLLCAVVVGCSSSGDAALPSSQVPEPADSNGGVPTTSVAPTTTSSASATTVAVTTAPTSTVGAPTTASPPPAPYPAGLTEHTIDVDGAPRSFLVHVPTGLGVPRAVVLVLHGGGGTGVGVADEGTNPLAVFREVADREGLVIVYPAGLPANDREGNPGWADCRSDNATSSGADDVGFLAALIGLLGDQYAVPSEQIFVAGGSNGAQMTHAFAFHHPELVGAAASSAGSLPASPRPGPCTDGPARPVPMLLVHGSADTAMPYQGGCVANLGGACRRGSVVSAEATRDRWLAINGLIGVAPTETVVEIDQGDGGPAHRFVYDGPTPVEWWRLDGAGHTVASRTVLIPPTSATGIQSRDIEFAEVAWAFFAQRLTAAG